VAYHLLRAEWKGWREEKTQASLFSRTCTVAPVAGPHSKCPIFIGRSSGVRMAKRKILAVLWLQGEQAKAGGTLLCPPAWADRQESSRQVCVGLEVVNLFFSPGWGIWAAQSITAGLASCCEPP
jgi:hypothetical protein